MEIELSINDEIEKAVAFAKQKNGYIEYSVLMADKSINFKNKGIVYLFYVEKNITKETSLIYIGKSKGSLFKQRLINHFDHKHDRTASKLEQITNEIKNGNRVLVKYITTTPESYRNLIEEELIERLVDKTYWNIQRGTKK